MSKLIMPICASLLAAKIKETRNARLPAFAEDLERWPILEEILWFLQWLSWDRNYAGGLAKFAARILETFPMFITTVTLATIGKSKMSFPNACALHDELPVYLREELIGDDCLLKNAFADPDFVKAAKRCDRDAIQCRGIKLMSSAKVVRSVRAYANENLADHLHALCVDKSFNVINNRRLWYFPQFVECLIAAKKQWAEQQLKAVAKTSVYRLITKWFELAEQVEYAVVLEGSSRRGKTYACENYCRAYPHKFRFLATPDEPSYTAMLDALFQAIGIEESSTSSSPHKRRKLISEALEYSRITYIFDEAQFLFPPALKEGTTPQRLNFFRRIFMDTPQSVVLICTPQTLAKSSKRLRKIAKYETDQWDGRILGAPISLPDEFTEKELAEVMQMHLPEVDPGIPSYVAMIFRSVQEYRLSKLVSIAKLARSFARDEAQSIPKLSHVESAIKIVLSDRGAPSPD